MLPEGRARTRLAVNASVDPDDVLGFLAVYGRDTAGALVLVPAGQDPTLSDVEPRPLGSDDADRLHQEDAAQLLGLDTTDPDRKFQHGRALPSLRAIAAALERLGVDLAGLVARMTFSVAIGDTDAHAKNLSVLHDEAGTHRLAPPYDVAFHTHHSHADARYAMDIAGRRNTGEVTGSDLVDEVRSWRLTRRQARRTVTAALESMHVALAAIDRAAHPGVTTAAWQAVDHRVQRLKDELVEVDTSRR